VNFSDPFFAYSFLLRIVVYILVPAFMVMQYFRVRNALHVFQLEGYKGGRFLEWCRSNPGPAWFLRRIGSKKALVMTGRAWRLSIAALVLNLIGVLVLPGIAHLAGGAPYDLVTWAGLTLLMFFGLPYVLVTADKLLMPVQSAINSGYEKRALSKLRDVGPTVIGITGSFGKTSTKFAVARLLGPPNVAFATPGSYNTPMGVVRAINEGLTEAHRYLVVEMGAYREGDVAELCAFVKPRIGILTAIGPAHLERFGSLDAIRRAKYEIVEGVPDDGVAIMNVDDHEVRALADKTDRVPVVRYGIDPDGRPDVTATEHSYSPAGTKLTIKDREGGELRVQTRLLGAHAVGHVLAGVAVACELGVPLADLGPRITALEPVEHRLQLIAGAGGVTVIDDAFNSNPDGAAAALDVLDQIEAPRKVVVTPGIIELGELQATANERFGAHAGRVADVLIVVGKANRDALVRGASGASAKAEVVVVDRLDDATERLKTILRPGDVVLFENDLPDQLEI
jgi:UDP-N-acetylmuramoyl-tripeptide--D-alanyl-D-alanine ligase